MNTYNPNIHHRRSVRLKGYDYSQAGLYFITICCQNRACLFGEIVGANNHLPNNHLPKNHLPKTIPNHLPEMVWNEAGKIANECWLAIPNHFPNVVLHEYVIMPNHIHGIVEILNGMPVGAENLPPNNGDIGANARDGANVDSPLPRSPSKTIGSIVRGFKIGVTKWMRKNTDVYDVWQRNYYEHVIRDEQSHCRISEYIKNNPAKWHDDKFYKKTGL